MSSNFKWERKRVKECRLHQRVYLQISKVRKI
jgi:hypothetical protein